MSRICGRRATKLFVAANTLTVLLAGELSAEDEKTPPVRVYRIGDVVTIGGPNATNWLGGFLMDIYILPHRNWSETDSLEAYAIHRSRVKTDANGTIPRTKVWQADRPGRFDIIADYQNDGKFTETLDAFITIVVEDPAARIGGRICPGFRHHTKGRFLCRFVRIGLRLP